MKPGIYPDMTREEYDAINALNWSRLVHMLRSPRHFKHFSENLRESTPALFLGRVTHAAIFEPERFLETFVVEPDFGDCRFKENKIARDEWRADHSDRECVPADVYDQALGISASLHACPLAMRYLQQPGHREVTVVWERDGLLCKARLDFLCSVILELKGARDISERAFTRAAATYNYHCQMAWQRDGVARATHDSPRDCVVVTVEPTPPHDVAVWRYDRLALEYGAEVVSRLLETLRACRESGDWPGMYPTERALTVPDYLLDDMGAPTLTIGGEEITDAAL